MSNQVPTRLLVLQRLTALLAQTTFADINGVQVSLEGAVFRGRNLVGEESKPWPIVTIMEAPQPDFGRFAGSGEAMQDGWQLLIQGIIENDMLNPSDNAHYLRAAVEIQLAKITARKASGSPQYPEHYMLGELITSVEISAPVVRPPSDKASAGAFFFLPVRVGIATTFGEPYTTVP